MRIPRLVPDKTDIRFLRLRQPCFLVSGVLMLLSIVLIFYPGLNFGIDFRGGIMMEVRTPVTADLAQMRSRLGELGLGEIQLQRFGAETDVLIRVQRQEGDASAQEAAAAAVREALDGMFEEEVDYRRIEFVGPKVSEELLRDGILAVTLALVAVLVYIWFRFEWQYGLGAIIALVHDVLLTMGMFAVTGLEVNLSTVAAVLTIVGYSLNDTVVIYDRVRENIRRYKKLETMRLLDVSLNETLARTVMTSTTTLLALLALYFFGGEVIKGFTFAMIWGVVVGTYSTVYIAAPVLLYFDLRAARQAAAAEEEEQPAE